MPTLPLFDGFTSLADGMNESRKPPLIAASQFSRGINLQVRGGYASTRPALIRETITGMPTDAVFQGAGVWMLDGTDYIVFVASGTVYTINVDSNALVSHGRLMDPSAVCYFEQADRYFVVQDNISSPSVLELVGGVPVITSESVDITIGSVMQYAHGRLHVRPDKVPGTSLNGKPYIVSGNIASPLAPANVLLSDETEYLSSGGAHSLPLEMGYVHAMGVLRNAQTGTGLGELIVFGKHGVSAFDMSLPRSQWQDQQLSRVLFFGPGCLSPRSVIPVNDDLAYRAVDGLRLLRYTASRIAGSSGSLSNVPMSREVNSWLERQDLTYLDFIASTFFDNRMITTVSGTGDRYFKGLVSFDTAVSYDKTGTAAPAYDGIWTGLNFAQPIMAHRNHEEICFVFAEGPVLYRVDPDQHQDRYADPETWDYTAFPDPLDEELAALDPGVKSIESVLITRALTGENIIDRKTLDYAELWVSDLRVDTTIQVYYRPMFYPLWAPLGSAKAIKVGEGSLPQHRRKLRFALDPTADVCDPTIKEKLYSAYGFQLAIKWTGHMAINSCRVSMRAVPEANPSQCAAEEAVVLDASTASGISIGDFEYTLGSSS